MKNIKKYISGALAVVAVALGLASCQDHFDDPTEVVPVATMQANTTILEFKKMMWKTSVNYCEPVYTKEYYAAAAGTSAEELERLKTEGTHIIIKGRVCSSDYAGNVFRSISLQDEEGTCLNFSIYTYNLYLTYRVGQEIVVDLTGLHAGRYSGLFQIGAPEFDQVLNADGITFLAPGVFNDHRELNGLPQPAKVDTVICANFNDINNEDTDNLQKWQSRLVRFDNVSWVIPSTESPGVETLATYHETVNQQIQDANGAKLTVRTSGYANFWNTKMPEGTGSVIGILGYYKSYDSSTTAGWQLTLIDARSIQFGDQAGTPGTEDDPYTVEQAIGFCTDGSNTTGWVRGYIVGTVAPLVTEVTSNDDIQFTATPDLGATLVIGETPETTDFEHCLIVELKPGSELREVGALRENPGNYKKHIDIRGTFGKVMGANGITNNDGTAAEFKIEGVTPSTPSTGEDIAAGNGEEATPYNVAQVIAKAPSDKETALETGVWVAGYIVGSCTGISYDTTEFTADANSSETNFVLGPTPDCTNTSLCIPVALPSAVRAALNLKANPGNLHKKIAVKADIIKYFGVPGLKNMTTYVLDGEGEGGGDTPATGSTLYEETFMNSSLGKFTVENKIESAFEGWYAKNSTPLCAIANSYVNGTNVAAESWLISPTIGLQGCSDLSMSVDQGLGFYFPTAQDKYYTVLIQEEGGDWNQLTLTNFPAKGSGNWSSNFATNTFDISAYAGKTIRVAFRYINDGAESRAWELQNFKITGTGTANIGEGGGSGSGTVTPSDPTTPDTPDTPTGPSDQGGTSGTFNFSDPTTLTPAYSEADQIADGTTGNYKIDVADVTFTAGSASVTNSGSGTAARLYHQSSGAWTFRYYKNTVTTIAVAAGYHITKIEFTPQTTSYATALSNSTYSSGTFADNVWTPTDEVSTLTITPSATTGLTNLVVYYSK